MSFDLEVFSNTADGVFVVDRRQRIVMWNDAARRLLGFEQKDVLGRPCYQAIGGRDDAGCVICRKNCDVLRSASRAVLSPTRDYQVRSKDGRTVWINVSTLLLPSRWSDLSVLAHIFRDVSRAKALESTLETLLGSLPAFPDPQLPGLPAVSEPLTARETEVLRLLAAGLSTEGIGARLGIGRPTVRTHVQRVLAKLGVHSRLEAVTLAFRLDLV